MQTESIVTQKAKLPRKRKKAAINAQGRKWYRDTIRLYYTTQKAGKFYEPVCKFWVNSSVVLQTHQVKGKVIPIPTPTRYW